jgi:hypothetical protein
MPETLKEFLASLNTEQADELWLWLDGYPTAVEDMIALLAQQVKNA